MEYCGHRRLEDTQVSSLHTAMLDRLSRQDVPTPREQADTLK